VYLKAGRTVFSSIQRHRESVSGTKRKADDPKLDKEETDTFAMRPDGEKKITFTDLLICGKLGAAWLPLGIAVAAGIGGHKYWQSKAEKSVEEYKPDDPVEVRKLKAPCVRISRLCSDSPCSPPVGVSSL
jgi:hypothetical protein